MDDSMKEIITFKKSIEEGNCISEFGSKADSICNSAIERFSAEAPLPDEDKAKEAVYDKKVFTLFFIIIFLFLFFIVMVM